MKRRNERTVVRSLTMAGLLAAGLTLAGCSSTGQKGLPFGSLSAGPSETVAPTPKAASESSTKPISDRTAFAPEEEVESHLDKLVVRVASFTESQPSGVAVSEHGRVFVSFPYWSKQPDVALAEVFADGTLRPFPRLSWNRWDGESGPSALNSLVSAEAILVDELNYLWVLDSGNPQAGDGIITAGPKLVRIDLTDNSVAQVFYIDHKRQLGEKSFLSDFRVDLEKRVAYLADAGSGAIIVYDLTQRWAASRLLGDPSTAPVPGTAFTADRTRAAGAGRLGVWGLTLTEDREWLYYQPLGSRELYRIATDDLLNADLGDAQLTHRVESLGDLGTAVDGLWLDGEGRLYAAGLENHAIIAREPHGQVETVVAGPELQWPDSIAIGPDGYLYFTTSMRDLASPYSTKTKRTEPYALLRVSLDKVQAAAKAKRRADEARERAAEARLDAERVRRAAQQTLREAEAKRAAAERAAQRVELEAETVYQAHLLRSQASRSVAEVAVAKEQAAVNAQAALRVAEARTEAAREATDIAGRLMKLAQARASEALALREKAYDAEVDVALAEAEAEAATYALREAELVFRESEKLLRASEESLASQGLNAVRAWAAAEQATKAAKLRSQEVYSADAAEQLARRLAEQAAQEALAAEFAEVPGFIPRVGTASVPVD
ncbi:L-dopachrome tautomerase-related protein [Mucisphaera sp.]|uniref:L-dopachrome tautomerase-related protein n=1 Tax=Mucisphaera sp. TaxID=2913024 RepID=UPI003D0B0E97